MITYTYILDKAKNLGFWFDSKMKMVTNINKCLSAAFFNIFNIRRIRKFLTYETAKNIGQFVGVIAIVFFMGCQQVILISFREFKTLQLD